MADWKDPEIVAFRAALAAMAQPADAPVRTWPERRQGFDAMGAMAPMPQSVTETSVNLGGVAGLTLKPKNADATRAILYLHGGGYCIGGSPGYRVMGARMAEAAGATVHVMDYRLAPEHPFPAAVDDALAAYRALLAGGQDPSRVVIAGDSAGGGLTIATAVAARDAGLPMPAGLHVISPWANLTNASAAYAAKGETDVLITQKGIDEFAAMYLAGKTDPKTPLASPVFADLTGLPPLLIQVGSEEVLMSDSTQLAERAGLAGVDVTLRIWPEMIHIWPFFAALTAGGRAIAESSAWIKARVS